MKNKMITFWKKIQDHKIIIFLDLVAWRLKNNHIQASSTQLAYFTLLSIFPFLIVLLNILSRMSMLYVDVINDVIILFPVEAREVIHVVISDLQMGFGSNLQLIVSLLGTLYSASLGVKPMITNCNQAYRYKEEKTGLDLIFTSLIFTIAFMALLILLFATKLMGDNLFRFVMDFFSLPSFFLYIWYLVKNLLLPIYMILLIFLINKYSLPKTVRKKIRSIEMIPGALATTIMMGLISSAFTLSMIKTDKYAVTYGSISGVIIMIVWLYFMGTSLVLGFEINGAVHDFCTQEISSLNEKRVFRIM